MTAALFRSDGRELLAYQAVRDNLLHQTFEDYRSTHDTLELTEDLDMASLIGASDDNP